MKNRLLILFCLTFIFPFSLLSQELEQFETETQQLIYFFKGSKYLVPHTAASLENAIKQLNTIWDYKSKERITVFFEDFSDVGNGGTIVIPRNFLLIEVSPFNYTFGIIPSNDRMQWLMNHELTHVVMTDKPAAIDRFYRSVFGSKVLADNDNPISHIYSYLTTPRWYCPRWYQEGIAVLMETWLSGGLGRVLGGYDEMVFRTLALENDYFYRVAGLETEGTTIDFQVGANSYLYGTRFISYLARKYGVEKLMQFYSRTEDSYRFYASQFKHTFNISVSDAWDEWIEYEKDFQQKNFERIKKNKITEYRQITGEAIGSVSKPFFDKKNKKLLAAVNYPGSLAHISSFNLETGKEEKLTNLVGISLYDVTSIAYNPEQEKIFYSTHNGKWRSIRSFDIQTEENQELIEYSRTGDFAVNKIDNSLWGVQHYSGRATIVNIPEPYKKIVPIHTLQYGKSFFNLTISNDGKYLLGTLSDAIGKQELVRLDLHNLSLGKFEPEKIYEFEGSNASEFVFSDDNRYVFGTSYYTGVSNVFRINLETKKLDILTNTETGFFRPLQISEDSLLVFKYTGNGMLPCVIKIEPLEDVEAIEYFGQKIVEDNPIVKSWILPPASSMNIDSLYISEGSYSPISEMKIAGFYPIVEGYKDYAAFGYKFNIMDPIALSSLKTTISYTPNLQLPEKERFHINFDYSYWRWNLKATYNYANFYDLFGPTKVSRKGYSIALKYKEDIIIHKAPEEFNWSVRLAGYFDLEKMPDYQNVDAAFDKLFTGLFSLKYSFMTKSLGSVEDENGISSNFYFYNSLVNEKYIPKLFADVSLATLLPMKNSIFWLRLYAGHSFGDKENPFTNFYFGGFGNNWVDYQDAQRYRSMESFPGFGINQLGAKNFAKAMLEWNSSPLRFRSLGWLWFYVTYSRLSVFSSVLASDFNQLSNIQTAYSVGTQLEFELVFFSLLKTNLAFGYGFGFQREQRLSKEFMLSLKLF